MTKSSMNSHQANLYPAQRTCFTFSYHTHNVMQLQQLISIPIYSACMPTNSDKLFPKILHKIFLISFSAIILKLVA